jgi:hypothetical protein
MSLTMKRSLELARRDRRAEIVVGDRKERRTEQLADGLRERHRAGRPARDIDAVAGHIHRCEERQAGDVVPVQMRQLQRVLASAGRHALVAEHA